MTALVAVGRRQFYSIEKAAGGNANMVPPISAAAIGNLSERERKIMLRITFNCLLFMGAGFLYAAPDY